MILPTHIEEQFTMFNDAVGLDEVHAVWMREIIEDAYNSGYNNAVTIIREPVTNEYKGEE